MKLFTFHNWLGYIGLATAFTHPMILLLSSTAGFTLFDIAVPIWSPTQPFENTLGAIRGYNVGGGYAFKRLLVLEWLAGTVETQTFGAPGASG